MKAKSSYYTAARRQGVHTTTKPIETRRNGNQWHAPLRTFDASTRQALAEGKVVRNLAQGFDAFQAGPRFINVRFAS
jgi:hypothetical protein